MCDSTKCMSVKSRYSKYQCQNPKNVGDYCFKHGIGKSYGTIEIDIQYSGDELHFSTRNSIERRENPLNHNEGGIGILNVEKRLNLLYPNKHQLKFTNEAGLFNVDMTIGLD